MSTASKQSGYEHIRLVSPYEIQTLSSVQIEKKVNEHAHLHLTAIIPEEKKDRYIDMSSGSDTIQIQEIDEGNAVRTLFHGVISDMAIKSVRGIYYLELEGISHTSRMDIKLKSRSFQNRNMLYQDLVHHILSEYPGSDCIDLAFDNASLNQFTLQYQETDWQFLKRMASRFGAVLIPEAAADSPKLWIGVPDGKADSLTNAHYSVMRTLIDWHNNDALQETDVTSYSIETERYYSIGDRIVFKDKELTVMESTARFNEGAFTYEYLLRPATGIRQNPMTNPDICGASLEGKIIDVTKDKVQVHLNIDSAQAKQEACWFPYSSVYTAEGNSGFYCMPQMGDAVQVYFPSRQEEEAVALNSVRRGGRDSPKMANPGVKYWGTNFGKEVKFGSNDLVLTAKENHVFVKMDEHEGIEIHSKQAIVFHTEKDLELKLDKKLDIQAREAVYLLCGGSSIVLDGETDIQGTSLRIEGLTKAPVYVKDLEPESGENGEAAEGPKKGLLDKFLDGVQLALDVVGMIPVVGKAASVANAGISAARGDYTRAGLSLVASVPYMGLAATGGKLAPKGMLATGSGLAQTGGTGLSTNFLIGKVLTAARKMQSNHSQEEMTQRIKNRMRYKTIIMFNRQRIYVPLKKGEVVYQPTALDKSLDAAKGAWAGGTEAVKSTLDTAKAVLNDPIGVTANVVTGTAAEAWKWVSNPEKAWDELVAEAEADGRRIQNMIDTEDWNGIAKGVGNSIVSGITDKGIGKVVKLKSGSGGKGNSGKNEKSSNKGTGKTPVPTKPGGGSNPKDFVNPHSEKHLYDPSRPSTPNRSQYGKDVDVEKLRQETMTNPDKAFSNWPNPNNPNPNRITKYYKEFDGNISTPDTSTGSHRVFEHLDDPTRSSHFPYVPRNKE
ncbi:contractile injection system protein, VgrG/Pvc8 family [Paenibacillus sp. MER TA 81-3]|uniref:contractile injection system protein, VgrG/Pvc8 family n=1 Tax=Paenibacillus sp. MER TA 81-3 TaxID=2939573 RepID=UPI00203AAB9B|nr:contractile injection system protein, VgrG/Pvc8 family [Paenibacillus sp. MER TA 81-3]MCM3340840.1 contractile injection system protein, VgrG/Pvc8 family [Paenibacillus sp. MER TA 81-3]